MTPSPITPATLAELALELGRQRAAPSPELIDRVADALAAMPDIVGDHLTPRVDQVAPWFGSDGVLHPGIHALLDWAPPRDGNGGVRERHRDYWGLCCGGAGAFIDKPVSGRETLIDLHPWLTHLLCVLSCDPWRLRERLRWALTHRPAFELTIARLAQVPPERFLPIAGYDQDGGFTDADAQLAAAIFLAWWCGKGDTAGSVREGQPEAFSVRFDGNGGTAATRFASAMLSIGALHARLRGVNILRDDALAVIPRIADERGTALYIDPPFVAEGDHYTHPFRVDPMSPSGGGLFAATGHSVPDDHDRLEEALRRFRSARVVVRYFDHERVRAMYTRSRGWVILDCGHGQRDRKTGRWSKPDVLIVNLAEPLSPGGRAGSAATAKAIESKMQRYMRDFAPDCPYHGVIT